MASLNKQMKGFKSFYKSRDEAHHNVPARNSISMSSVDKTSVYKYNWLNGKSKKDSDQNCGEVECGGRKVVVEGRKSVSQVETNLASLATFLQVKVLVSDMPEMMQVEAFRTARRSYDSLEKFSSKYMAYNIKKEFDKVHGPAWHCIVGSSFGSFVTHSTGCFLYFSMEKLYILLFRTKIQKANE
ncbi:uncharacterized protein LOC111493764 [Cucurbita maxima]|uniref:Uncharacterized protein LOC111493764 n=1 Tax=Cucurbita maxima TaxID=3661 RepID=A0A6J1KGV2_CUCMA|nr:uncharacterized protein LOC111493764 [Cucurbita maxima]